MQPIIDAEADQRKKHLVPVKKFIIDEDQTYEIIYAVVDLVAGVPGAAKRIHDIIDQVRENPV